MKHWQILQTFKCHSKAVSECFMTHKFGEETRINILLKIYNGEYGQGVRIKTRSEVLLFGALELQNNKSGDTCIGNIPNIQKKLKYSQINALSIGDGFKISKK